MLLAGPPGAGKSTLALQVAQALRAKGHRCLFASAEESRDQVAARAARIGIDGADLAFLPGRDLAYVLAVASGERPDLLVVDSIHTVRDSNLDGLPGGSSQVRSCTDALAGLAKEHGIGVVLLGHVTKDGDLAGPRALEHAVDVVLTFEGDARSGHRTLSSGKNRFGREGEVAWFEMRSSGLEEREAGPRLGRAGAEIGAATALALVGRRAFAVDVEALAVPSDGAPHRQVAGLDPRRFHIVAAVTERATALRLVRCELYGTASGGIRLDDPGTDLAVAAALASSAAGVAPPADTAFVGEVSLTGAVRRVAAGERRFSAAQAVGIQTLVWPAEAPPPPASPGSSRVVEVDQVSDALWWALASERGNQGRPGR